MQSEAQIAAGFPDRSSAPDSEAEFVGGVFSACTSLRPKPTSLNGVQGRQPLASSKSPYSLSEYLFPLETILTKGASSSPFLRNGTKSWMVKK